MTRPSNVCFKNIAQLLCTAFVNRNEHTQVKKTRHMNVQWFCGLKGSDFTTFYNPSTYDWGSLSIAAVTGPGPTDYWFSSHIWHQKKRMKNGQMTGQSWENHWDIHGSCLFFMWVCPSFWEHHGLLAAAHGLGLLDETFSHLALDAGGGDLPHLLLEQNAHDFFQVQLKMS